MSPSVIKDDRLSMTDTVEALSEPLSSMSNLPSLVSLLSLTYKVRDPAPAKQGRLTTLLRTISPEPRPAKAKTYSHDEMLSSFVNFLSPVLNGMAGMEDFEKAVDGFAHPDNFADFWTIEGHNLIRDMSEGEGLWQTMLKGNDTFQEVFCRDLSLRVAYGRDTGCLMLVPGDAQVGDVVRRAEGEDAWKLTKDSGGVWIDAGPVHISQV